ncbi:MAG: methyltransferase family protein [Candidatus Methylomirabilales bacterium]
MTAGLAILLIATFRWERGGRSLRARARTPVPRAIGWTWNVFQAVLLFYPILMVVWPDVAYGTVLHFSFPFDTAVQVLGLLLWALGVGLLLWCSRLLGPLMMTDGVVEGHELMTRGPFAVIRHPTYLGHMLMALGAATLFLSTVLLVLALLTILFAYVQARGEEQLLASPEGFGEAYRAYMRTTGRFLPRLRFRRQSV